MQVLVMDSHRPFHLYNVYGDGEDANGEFVDVGDLIVAVATRRIEPGAEILVTYGREYWRPPIAMLASTAVEAAVCEVVAAARGEPK